MLRKNSQKIAAVALLLFILVFAYKIVGGEKASEPKVEKLKSASLVGVADFKKTQASIISVGKIEALEQVEMRSQLSSNVKSVNVKIGDEVKKGDLLIELDHASLDAQLNQSSAMINRTQSSVDQMNAGASFEKIDQVKKAVDQSRVALEQVKVSNEVMVRNAENRLALAEANLENTGEQSGQAISGAYSSLEINISSYLSKTKTALTLMGDIIGEAPGKTSANHNYENLLGVKSSQSKQIAERNFASLRTVYEGISLKSTNQNLSDSELEAIATELAATLLDCDNALISFGTMLDNTVTDSNFSDTALNGLKAQIDGQIAIIGAAKFGLENDIQRVENSKISSSGSGDVNQMNYQNALDDLELTKKQAQVSQGSAESVLAIQEAAYNAIIAGPREVDLSGPKSAVREAQASYQLISSNREKAFIRAPFDGVISSVPFRVHDLLNPGNIAVSMVNDSGLQVKSYVNEKDRRLIKEGSAVIIEGDIEGVISRISPSIDPTTKKVEIIIVVSDKDAVLTIGQFVESKIKISEDLVDDDIYFLPLQSIKMASEGAYVYIVNENSEVELAEVELGRVIDTTVEVLSGLERDMAIIYSVRGLNAGDKLNIR